MTATPARSALAARTLVGVPDAAFPGSDLVPWQGHWPRTFNEEWALGDYLAEGSFGRVYTARRHATGQAAAVKVLSKLRKGAKLTLYREKVQREVRRAAGEMGLRHVLG